jgi:hypothetical protein
MNYDAELKQFSYFEPCGYGTIYGDKKGRFTDGEPIRTSTVLGKEEYSEGFIYQTRNSRYFVRHEEHV